MFLPPDEWGAYGRDAGGSRFVPACAIDRTNVSRLRPAWTFRTGDLQDASEGPSSAFECTPVLADGTLLVVSPFNRVFALDPDTGERKWSFDPKIARRRPQAVMQLICRGVSTWRDPTNGRRRVLMATNDGRLIALDLGTGRPVAGFGKGGTVDLRAGLAPGRASYGVTSPPCVVGSRVVVGSCIADDFAVDMPSGAVRAFDARTGRLVWRWNPLAKGGAGNAWAPISADPGRGLVFVPTGSASPDAFGGLRPGDGRAADSVTALRVDTGAPVWSFQAVRHDLWNYDVPAQPILTNVGGRAVVVVLTKMGHVFVLDRATGKPILPVEIRKVPASDVPRERPSPVQTFPILPKPLDPGSFEPWGPDAASAARVAARVKGLRTEGLFTPPSLGGTLVFPGFLGGANWSGGSVDPTTGTLFVNTNRFASIETLVPRDRVGGPGVADQRGAPYGVRMEFLFSGARLPGNRPPWGLLHAVDLETGALRWEVPLGVHPAVRNRPEAKAWGSPNLGGSFVTDTGLVFIAAAMDDTLRAFDAGDGHVVWSAPLPAGGQAAPMTFRSPKTGRTYVVQCAGGHHGLGTTEGDYVVAFRLE